MATGYWLVKTDPETFGLADLRTSPARTTRWDGVRNYQARNFLRDAMKTGDGVLLYHSSVEPPAVVATSVVVRPGYPDPTQFDRSSPGFDPAATPDAPRWFAVDLRLDEEFASPVSLARLRAEKGLANMVLLRKGSRLSVQPVTREEWRIVLRLGRGRGRR